MNGILNGKRKSEVNIDAKEYIRELIVEIISLEEQLAELTYTNEVLEKELDELTEVRDAR